MKKIRIYVHPEFKFKIERERIKTELEKSRKINLVDFTKNLDITPSLKDEFQNTRWYKNGKKKIPF